MSRKIPLIKTLMTPFPYALETTASPDAARAYLREHAIHHLPVLHEGRVAGLLHENDLDEALGSTLSDLLKGTPLVLDLDTRLDHVLTALAEHHQTTAVITRHDRLAGIFTSTDACREFARFIREEFGPPDGGDEAA